MGFVPDGFPLGLQVPGRAWTEPTLMVDLAAQRHPVLMMA